MQLSEFMPFLGAESKRVLGVFVSSEALFLVELEKLAEIGRFRVRQAREELGITQTALGRIVGCTQANVKQIEQIGVSPRSKYFLPLCEELGLNPFSFGFEGDSLAEIKIRLVDSWIEKHSETC